MDEKKAQDRNVEVEELLKGVPEDFIKQRIDPVRNKANSDGLDIDDINIPEERLECVMMELLYLDSFKREPSDDNSDLFPNGWFEYSNYEKQFEILVEAIAKKQKITETDGYNEFVKKRHL